MVVKEKSYRNRNSKFEEAPSPEELETIRDVLRYHYSEILKMSRYQLLATLAIALFSGAGLMFVIAIWLRG